MNGGSSGYLPWQSDAQKPPCLKGVVTVNSEENTVVPLLY